MNRKTIFTLTITYTVLLVVFVSTMVGVHTIPSQRIHRHAEASLNELQEEGLKYRIADFPLFRLDNFTDALMISVAVSADRTHPLRSAIQNQYAIKDDRMSIVEATNNLMQGETGQVELIPYERYWHGYLTILRPLLLFTDHHGLRILNGITFLSLFICVCRLLYTRGQRFTLPCFILSAIATNLWIVPLSLQYSAVFYITLGGMIFILLYKEQLRRSDIAAALFTVLGGLTAFFDLLTVPLVTLCLPLILFMTEVSERKWHDLCKASLYWTCAYCLIWTSKWELAHLLTGFNIMDDAVQQVFLRTSTRHEGFDMSIRGILTFLLPFLNTHKTLAVIGLGAILSFIFFTIRCYRKNPVVFTHHLYLPVISMMPIVWCMLTRNHSIIHYWFVWRLFVISIFAISVFYVQILFPDSHRRH